MALILNWNNSPDYPIRPATGRRFGRGEVRVLLRSEFFEIGIDEEFSLLIDCYPDNKPPNRRATELAGGHVPFGTILCGYAIWCKSSQVPN